MEADRVRPVYEPRPVQVAVDRHGAPRRVAFGVRSPGRASPAVPVARINDRWRVDDLWWRETPVSRMYWLVELADGRLEILFQDLLTGHWFRQPYPPPEDGDDDPDEPADG